MYDMNQCKLIHRSIYTMSPTRSTVVACYRSAMFTRQHFVCNYTFSSGLFADSDDVITSCRGGQEHESRIRFGEPREVAVRTCEVPSYDMYSLQHTCEPFLTHVICSDQHTSR